MASLESAIEKVECYAQRWKIENFHKVLKSGCHVDDAKLRSDERLTNLIAALCIIAYRVFWLTMVSRTNPRTSAEIAFTQTEITILNHLVDGAQQSELRNVSYYIIAVAKFRGYLDRKNDGPPGNTALWRGLSRLTDIQLGVELSKALAGN